MHKLWNYGECVWIEILIFSLPWCLLFAVLCVCQSSSCACLRLCVGTVLPLSWVMVEVFGLRQCNRLGHVLAWILRLLWLNAPIHRLIDQKANCCVCWYFYQSCYSFTRFDDGKIPHESRLRKDQWCNDVSVFEFVGEMRRQWLRSCYTPVFAIGFSLNFS